MFAHVAMWTFPDAVSKEDPRRMADRLKAAHVDIIFPYISYYSGWEFCQSRDGFAADWADWMRRGHIDFACPMVYVKSTRLVELLTQECKHLAPDAANTIWIGLAMHTPAEITEQLNRLEEMGQKNCVFFSCESLRDEHIPVLAGHRKG